MCSLTCFRHQGSTSGRSLRQGSVSLPEQEGNVFSCLGLFLGSESCMGITQSKSDHPAGRAATWFECPWGQGSRVPGVELDHVCSRTMDNQVFAVLSPCCLSLWLNCPCPDEGLHIEAQLCVSASCFPVTYRDRGAAAEEVQVPGLLAP